jgi:hypothetical protein
MAYGAYAGAEDYETLFPDDVPDEDGLMTASRHIDALTYAGSAASGSWLSRLLG